MVNEKPDGMPRLLSVHRPVRLGHALHLEVHAKPGPLCDVLADRRHHERPERHDLAVVERPKQGFPLLVGNDEHHVHVTEVRALRSGANEVAGVLAERSGDEVTAMPEREDLRNANVSAWLTHLFALPVGTIERASARARLS